VSRKNKNKACHPERTRPQALFSSGVPKERSLLFGVEVGGGESKNLLLFFSDLLTHYITSSTLAFRLMGVLVHDFGRLPV
jgi:hypothetical protein